MKEPAARGWKRNKPPCKLRSDVISEIIEEVRVKTAYPELEQIIYSNLNAYGHSRIYMGIINTISRYG